MLDIKSYDRGEAPNWLASCITPPNHYFWLPHPQHYKWAFTARMIYDNKTIDLVNDRYRLEGTKELNISWLFDSLILDLQEMGIDNQSNRIFVTEYTAEEEWPEDNKIIIASPNASYGYLYLSMWEKARPYEKMGTQKTEEQTQQPAGMNND